METLGYLRSLQNQPLFKGREAYLTLKMNIVLPFRRGLSKWIVRGRAPKATWSLDQAMLVKTRISLLTLKTLHGKMTTVFEEVVASKLWQLVKQTCPRRSSGRWPASRCRSTQLTNWPLASDPTYPRMRGKPLKSTSIKVPCFTRARSLNKTIRRRLTSSKTSWISTL